MDIQMRTIMDNFKEHVRKVKNRDVIISYDITAEYGKFRTDLLDLLDQFGKIEITQSTYKLKSKLNGEELNTLSKQIIELFEEIKSTLNEGNTRPKKVRVAIITTLDNSLFEDTLIDEEI